MATTAVYRKLAREAEERLDWRSAVIYWSRALDAYPISKGALAQADKDIIITAINEDKALLLSMCPVCGDHMHGTLCPDDVIRPWCPSCRKAYTPMGYTTDDDYAKKWGAREYSRDKAESYTTIEVI